MRTLLRGREVRDVFRLEFFLVSKADEGVDPGEGEPGEGSDKVVGCGFLRDQLAPGPSIAGTYDSDESFWSSKWKPADHVKLKRGDDYADDFEGQPEWTGPFWKVTICCSEEACQRQSAERGEPEQRVDNRG